MTGSDIYCCFPLCMLFNLLIHLKLFNLIINQQVSCIRYDFLIFCWTSFSSWALILMFKEFSFVKSSQKWVWVVVSCLSTYEKGKLLHILMTRKRDQTIKTRLMLSSNENPSEKGKREIFTMETFFVLWKFCIILSLSLIILSLNKLLWYFEVVFHQFSKFFKAECCLNFWFSS